MKEGPAAGHAGLLTWRPSAAGLGALTRTHCVNQGNAVIEILGVAVGAVVPLLGGLVWLIRLEGRINTEVALREALAARMGGFEERIYATLERIESKLDGKADK